MARNNKQENAGAPELQERVVYINRVSKTVKAVVVWPLLHWLL